MNIEDLKNLIDKDIDSKIKNVFSTLFSYDCFDESAPPNTLIVNVKRNEVGDEYQMVVMYKVIGERISIDFLGAKLKNGNGCLSFTNRTYSEEGLRSLTFDMVQHLKQAIIEQDYFYNKKR